MPPLERVATRLRSLIDDADAIIVGIGSGMSSAAGFNHYNRAGMARAGMTDWQQAFGFKSAFSTASTTSTPASSSNGPTRDTSISCYASRPRSPISTYGPSSAIRTTSS